MAAEGQREQQVQQHLAGQRGGHSYLYWQIALTEPVGQWLCAGGHSCRWSLARTDAGVAGRVERRRA